MSVERNAFNLFVTIDDAFTPTSDMMEQHKGYPIDNVIQIKLDSDAFKALFQDTLMSTSTELSAERYDAGSLLTRFENFFDRSVSGNNNHNNLASDITVLINNTYNDIDVNPVALETACAKNGDIFNYWIKSKTQHRHNPSSSEEYGSSEELTTSGEQSNEYNETGSPSTGSSLLVYEVVARELDNMISRGVNTDNVSTSMDANYSDLDALYALSADEFWEQSKQGDSIFIEGSFEVPTAETKAIRDGWKQNDVLDEGVDNDYAVVGGANLPIILQFVNSAVNTYDFSA